MTIEKQAATLRSFLEAAKKATPGPWAAPGANVFRLFAWKDCGEEGMKPRRCIVPDSMADVHYGRHHIKWPQTTAASNEAYQNLRLIAHAPEAAAAIVAVLRECEEALGIVATQVSDAGDRACLTLAAIRPILAAAEKKEDEA